jgi:hypothetical protein
MTLRRLALRMQPRSAHEAGAAGYVERHHDSIAFSYGRNGAPGFNNHPHRFVPENVSFDEERSQDLVQRRSDPQIPVDAT